MRLNRTKAWGDGSFADRYDDQSAYIQLSNTIPNFHCLTKQKERKNTK